MQHRYRALFLTNSSAFILIFCLCIGAIFGHLVGRHIQVASEQHQLDLYGGRLLGHAEQLYSAARKTLNDVNRSPYRMCSNEERHYLRGLLFSADHIKDIGRLAGDRLKCSIALGESGLNTVLPEPILRLGDGTNIYGDIPLGNADYTGIVIGQGMASVVLSSAALDLMRMPSYRFSVFIGQPDQKKYARLFYYPAESAPDMDDFLRPDAGVNGDTLQRKVCSADESICVVLAMEHDAVSHSARIKSLMATLLGVMGGALAGLVWLKFLYRDRSLNTLLRRAISRKDLTMAYQPIVNIGDGKIVSLEALLRWEINKGDFVPPDVFIAKAEEQGFIGQITRYVIELVLQEMGELLRSVPLMRITINISDSDLVDEAFFTFLAEQLSANSVSASQIGIELTERAAIATPESLAGLARLRAAGHILYIDDFGTGYSSLAYLGDLNVDIIKMDRAFTKTVGTDAVTVSIVPQIISMAQKHQLGIVAEGVETRAQADYFKKLPVAIMAQGYYFGAPMSAQKALKLFERNRGAKIALVKKIAEKDA